MFDVSNDISINLKTPSGPKPVNVRYPTDDEWIARAAKSKLTSRSIGNGKTVSEMGNNEKINFELLNKIKTDGPELDEFEASQVVDRLARAEVIESSASASGYTVTLKVPGGEVVHELKMPSAKQVAEYRKYAVRVIEGRRGASELTINLQASIDLYDALSISASGYAGSVPAPHKSAAVSEVIALLDALDDDTDVDGF